MDLTLTASSHPVSIIHAFKENDAKAPELLVEKFGQGLRILIQHRCAAHSEECFLAVISGTIAAILDGTVVQDSELPALIRRTVKRISSAYPQNRPIINGGSEPPSVSRVVVDQLRKDLARFNAVQLEAVYCYVNGQSATVICHDLGLEPDFFELIKKHVMFVAKCSIIESNLQIRRAPSVEDTATFKGAAVASQYHLY